LRNLIGILVTVKFGVSMIKEFINRLRGNVRSTHSPAFQHATVDSETIGAYNKGRSPGLTGSFCYAPGINMLFGQDGKIRACCHNMEFTLGEYPKQTIQEIWKGEAAEQLRNHLKNFDLSHGCDICQADMNTHSFEEVRARHFDSLPRNAAYPTMMEFLMTNTCNLECVMCKGEYSSLIRKNREKLPPIVSSYDKEFIKQLEEFIPHLHETRFSGSGEAFAIDMNYEIWEMIIRLNPKCIIMVQTNGSFLNARIKDLLSRGNFRIGVSLDSLNKETFESIRINANFERIMENIRYFSEYSRSKKEKFAIALCVMRQNWKELPDFIKFCNANNAVATLHKVWFPREHALHSLHYRKLAEISDYLSGFDWEAQTPLEQLNKRHFQYIVSSIKGWKENALLLRDEAIHVDALDENELMPYLQSKLRKELRRGTTSEKEVEDIVGLCTDKIAAVLQNYEFGEERLNTLKQMCKVPASDSLKALRYAPVEILVTQAKVFLMSDLFEQHAA
jgi:MoaA/NifB/PqqE/SkfB family radical SAM enzyme